MATTTSDSADRLTTQSIAKVRVCLLINLARTGETYDRSPRGRLCPMTAADTLFGLRYGKHPIKQVHKAQIKRAETDRDELEQLYCTILQRSLILKMKACCLHL